MRPRGCCVEMSLELADFVSVQPLPQAQWTSAFNLVSIKNNSKVLYWTVTCRDQEQTWFSLWKHSKQIILNKARLLSFFLIAARLFGEQQTESTLIGQQTTAELFNLSISHWFLITFRHKTVTTVYLLQYQSFVFTKSGNLKSQR